MMDYQRDDLELSTLAGAYIVKHKPIFSKNGEYIIVRYNNIIDIFSTKTCELVRKLSDSQKPLVNIELDFRQPDELIACTDNGTVLRWDWLGGRLLSTVKLELAEQTVVATFNQLFYNKSQALVIARNPSQKTMHWAVVDFASGKRLNIRCELKLRSDVPMVAVSPKHQHVVITQGNALFVLNYAKWFPVRYNSPDLSKLTAVCFNPEEESFATGDELGRIFVWRNYASCKNDMVNAKYHWHHTAISSLSFSASGTSLYSSAQESVLARWNMQLSDGRVVLPRFAASILHVAVSSNNECVVACCEDNSLQFIDAGEFKLVRTLQSFTRESDDGTGNQAHSIGLCRNPRTNTLVTNGRVGQLQFYSPYTKTLLYNLCVVSENKLSKERNTILYNVRVVTAACNIDWLVTGEVFNDQEHFPDTRLKFWRYHDVKNRYTLNTSIHMPHEGGFKTVAFSHEYRSEKLLCATVGKDNVVKMWTIVQSNSIYHKGLSWDCIAIASYKNAPVEAISFSADGSLLAAGFGNTLCIFNAQTLKLRAQLCTGIGLDGTVGQAKIRLPQTPLSSNASGVRRKQLWQLFQRLLETNDGHCVEEIICALDAWSKDDAKERSKKLPHNDLDERIKEQLYSKIINMNELNLHQKLNLLQKLKIRIQVPRQSVARFVQYVKHTIAERTIRQRTNELRSKLNVLNLRNRYKAKARFYTYVQHKALYDAEVNKNLVPILSLLSVKDTTISAATPTPQAKPLLNGKLPETTTEIKKEKQRLPTPPDQAPAQIRFVQFAAGESAHLLAVCTDSRLLIWDMLTLRLRAVLRISVKHLAFDPLTNLYAVINRANKLYVFHPNSDLAIYENCDLPELYDMTWVPRTSPKSSDIISDWQAKSTLYFLTQEQHIMYYTAPGATDIDAELPPALPAADEETAAPFVLPGPNKSKGTHNSNGLSERSVVNRRRDFVKEFIGKTVHAMPAAHLLSDEVILSLLGSVGASEGSAAASHTNGGRTNGYMSTSDSDDDEDADDDDDTENIERKLTTRIDTVVKSKSTMSATDDDGEQTELDRRMQAIELQESNF